MEEMIIYSDPDLIINEKAVDLSLTSSMFNPISWSLDERCWSTKNFAKILMR